MESEVYTTRTAQIWLDDMGIIHKVFLPDAQETLKDALESGEIIVKLCQDKRRPLLVNFTPVRSMDSDARAYYSGQKVGPAISAVGGITQSKIGKVIGNFFMGFNRPPTPGKIFNSEEDAVEWLKKFL